ncbi:MAG: RecQ family ATP-dependent DNA helicase [Flavobacteriales bacterium]|nr:RecQ family ATP-dependent DNA helicase [Flavobacteriales bacterium]
MENQIFGILKKYWGHKSFRPLQEDIIESILEGNDTLALLPTGGGKSICFQVPAMVMEGVCLVISPLIALMNDQVQNLRKRGITAFAITNAKSKREIDVALDNAVHGALKFVYVSPERIKSQLFKERLKRMKVSMVAVDEAHCISEWGHDFRPAYREIIELRSLLPKPTPFVALTATATEDVIDDIINKLDLNSTRIYKKSFTRENLIYVVQEEGHKLNRMVSAIKNLRGSGIIYVSTRRETLRQAHLLRANGIGALPYHGGMSTKDRQETQTMWIANKAQVVVATNAFGMGIDKPDVRFVIHVDLPSGLEAYFQEAGRAGRDGKKAYAICLVNDEDRKNLEDRVRQQIPVKAEIKKVYRALVNHYQLATGIASEDNKVFDLKAFAKRFNLNPTNTVHCLKALEREGILSLSDAIFNPSRVHVLMNTKELYSFEIGHPKLEPLIRVLLRSYEGLFDHPTKVDEMAIARRLKSNYGEVKSQLEYLAELRVITFQAHTDLPFITFSSNRIKVDDLKLNDELLKAHKKRLEDKMMAVLRYTQNDVICRSRQLVAYFDDYSAEDCGRCDVCLARKKTKPAEGKQFESYKLIKEEIAKEPRTLGYLNRLPGVKSAEVSSTLRWMADNKEIIVSSSNVVSLKS